MGVLDQFGGAVGSVSGSGQGCGSQRSPAAAAHCDAQQARCARRPHERIPERRARQHPAVVDRHRTESSDLGGSGQQGARRGHRRGPGEESRDRRGGDDRARWRACCRRSSTRSRRAARCRRRTISAARSHRSASCSADRAAASTCRFPVTSAPPRTPSVRAERANGRSRNDRATAADLTEAAAESEPRLAGDSLPPAALVRHELLHAAAAAVEEVGVARRKTRTSTTSSRRSTRTSSFSSSRACRDSRTRRLPGTRPNSRATTSCASASCRHRARQLRA